MLNKFTLATIISGIIFGIALGCLVNIYYQNTNQELRIFYLS